MAPYMGDLNIFYIFLYIFGLFSLKINFLNLKFPGTKYTPFYIKLLNRGPVNYKYLILNFYGPLNI